MSMGNGSTPANNLHETHRELAAAKRRHPAGKKAPAKTPAKKAPAKKAAAKKAAATAAAPKVRWTVADGMRGKQVAAVGVCGSATYAIAADGEKWRATCKRNGKTTTLLSGASYAKAYAACLEHARKAVAA
jgi:hypothetical protein